jgi:hypothetical protein
MQKRIIFCFTICTLSLTHNSVKAQQEPGQIVINAGVGYSPGFDGQMPSLGAPVSSYPVNTILETLPNYNDEDDPPGFNCSSISPNLGGTIDIGILKWISAGLAASYQGEVLSWGVLSNQPLNFSDKITRINLSGRILFHLPMKSTHFDFYTGIRSGASFWHDIESSSNIVPPGFYGGYFLTKSNLTVPSFQFLLGLRYYPIKWLGIHVELGFGSPYLVEGGLSFRINTHKEENTQATSAPNNNKK